MPGDWVVWRFSSDPAGKQNVYCTARINIEADLHARFSYNAGRQEFGFGPTASGMAGKKDKVTVWFDKNKKTSTVYEGEYGADGGAGDYLAVIQKNATPAAGDAFRGRKFISFGYRSDNASRVDTASLRGVKPAFAKLFDCAAGR